MTIKKFAGAALLLFVAATLFVSCGSTSGSTGSASSGSNQEIKGSVTGRNHRDHQIAFRDRQVLTVSMDQNNKPCYFNILTPSGEAIFNGSMEGNKFSGTMSFTGSYTIRVYLMGAAESNNETVNYTLRYNLK